MIQSLGWRGEFYRRNDRSGMERATALEYGFDG